MGSGVARSGLEVYMKVKDSSLYVTKDDIYLFGKGEWHQSYEKLGAHVAMGLSLDSSRSNARRYGLCPTRIRRFQ